MSRLCKDCRYSEQKSNSEYWTCSAPRWRSPVTGKGFRYCHDLRWADDKCGEEANDFVARLPWWRRFL